MDYAALNRVQLILNVAARMEKRAGRETLPVQLGQYLMRAGKNVGKAGYEATMGASKYLRQAGHPMLAAGVVAAPLAGGYYGAKKLQEKYRMWKAIRAARRQGYQV